ncbi:MAG: hypothetical protein D6784_06445 [Chloroflexi bacterium]|nr:MAG: hypothetical protein D6784_06445 [Chloroflexota bacterium]
MSRVQQLYRLQLLDSRLDGVKKRLAEVEAGLGESRELRQAKDAVQTARDRLKKAQTTVTDLDLEVNALAQKITNHEKLLYSGKTMSPKEAANLQEEVASLKRWRSQREEALLEAMVAVEEAEAVLSEAEARLNEVEKRWQESQAGLLAEQKALQAELAELEAQRPEAVSAVDGADIEEYEALRRKRAGRAVAEVKNGVCQGCGVAPSYSKVQKARSGTELVYCSTCGRILYAP